MALRKEILWAIDRAVDRKIHGENGTLGSVRLIPDIAVVQLYKRLGQVQSNANAIVRERTLHEALEQLWSFLFRYAYARVFDTYLNLVVGETDSQFYVSIAGRIFECIRQDVNKWGLCYPQSLTFQTSMS